MIVTNAGTIPVLQRIVHTEFVHFVGYDDEVWIRTHNVRNGFHFRQSEDLEQCEKSGVRCEGTMYECLHCQEYIPCQ